MGLYDRDYMRRDDPGRVSRQRKISGNTWWERLKFNIWLFFHPAHRG